MDDIIDENDQLELANRVYAFPCLVPFTIIGGDLPSFHENLTEALRYIQDGAEFEITSVQASKKGKYNSFRIRIMIADAEELLEKRTFLRNLDGVVLVM